MSSKSILIALLSLFFVVVVMVGYVFVHSEFFAPSATNSAIKELTIIEEEIELAKDNKETPEVFEYHINKAKLHIERARKDMKSVNF